jgi:WD40 repeat protein
VNSVAFSPDGHQLVSGGTDQTVRLWSVDTQQALAEPFIGHAKTVTGVAFSRDGQHVASASFDNTIRLWPAHGVPNMLCDKLNANMSRRQWHDWVSADIGYQAMCPALPVPADSAGAP